MHGRELYFLINFVITLLINVPGKVDCKPVTNNLRPVADQMSQMARVLNGITLGQSLLDGSADLDKILEELMNVGPVVRLSELEHGGLDELDGDLGKMETTVETTCGTKECVDLKMMNEVVKASGTIDLTMFGKVEKALDDTVLNDIRYIDLHFDSFPAASFFIKEDIHRFIALRTISHAEFDTVYKEKLSLLSKITDSFIGSFEKVIQFAESKKEHKKVVDSISTILVIKDVSALMHTLSLFKTESQKLISLRQDFSSFFNKTSFKYFESFNVMGELAPREGLPYNKLFAQGFSNGLEDIDSLVKDLDSDFVKDVLANGGNMKEVKTRLLAVMELRKKLTDVLNTWNSVKIPKTIRTPISKAKEILRNVIDETDQMMRTHSLLEPFRKCIEPVSSEELNVEKINDLESFRKKFEDIDSRKSEFPNLFKSKLPSSELKEKLSKLEILLEGVPTEELLADLKGFEGLDDVIRLSQTLLKIGEEIDKSSLRNDLKGFARCLHVIKKFLGESGIKTALECIQNITEVPKTISFPQSSILKLKGNPDIKAIRSFSKSLQVPIKEIKKWKQANHTFKSKDAKPFWKLSDPWKTTVDFANAAEQIRDVARIYEEREAVKQMVMASDKIDEQARNLKDKEQKEVVKEKWDMLTKGLLRVTYNQLKELNQKMPNITNFSGFLTALDVADTFFYPYTDVSDLQETLKFVKEPVGIQEAIAKVSKLNLNFVSCRFKIIHARAAIPEILESLNPSEPTTTTTTRQPTVQDDYVDNSNWKANVGIGVFLAILGLVLCYLMVELMSGFEKRKDRKKE